jgi:L-alanine-DL-glutamate epimerase-like enolase superfamily enzyme
MTRRTLMLAAMPAPNTRTQPQTYRVELKNAGTTTMPSSDYRDVIYFMFTRGVVSGVGEGAPIPRYQESAAGARKLAKTVEEIFSGKFDPMQYRAVIDGIHKKIPGQWALKPALDIAIHDWVGQQHGIPIYKLLGLDPLATPVTSFSIGIDTPEMTRRNVREADPYPVLKIKAGLDSDEATMEAVRSVTKKPLRVDANEGWKTREEAVRKINWLESQGGEFVEQPMAAHLLEEVNWIRKRVHLPIVAGEASWHPADVPKPADYYDGINVKLDQCGGILEALRMIEMAKSLGLKTVLGCMISTPVAVTAAAHLSPLADWADLDGNLLIRNDPYVGVTVEQGKLILPGGNGLGLVPRRGSADD